jgi:hypothetical protein
MQRCVLASGLLEALAAAALQLAAGGSDDGDGDLVDWVLEDLHSIVLCFRRSGRASQLEARPALVDALLQLVPLLVSDATAPGVGYREMMALKVVRDAGLLESQPARLRELQLQRVLEEELVPWRDDDMPFSHAPVMQLLHQAASSWAQPGPGEVQALMQVLSPYLEVRVLGRWAGPPAARSPCSAASCQMWAASSAASIAPEPAGRPPAHFLRRRCQAPSGAWVPTSI